MFMFMFMFNDMRKKIFYVNKTLYFFFDKWFSLKEIKTK